MENFKSLTFPIAAKPEKNTILDQNSHLGHKTQPWGL